MRKIFRNKDLALALWPDRLYSAQTPEHNGIVRLLNFSVKIIRHKLPFSCVEIVREGRARLSSPGRVTALTVNGRNCEIRAIR